MTAGGSQQLPFPFLCLLVSGGHNLLVLVKGVGHYMQLGTTLDDALGQDGPATTTANLSMITHFASPTHLHPSLTPPPPRM